MKTSDLRRRPEVKCLAGRPNRPFTIEDVATAADSLEPRESTAVHSSFWLGIFECWHLLSLDAPTVSALWAWFFARSMGIALPWHAPLLLAIGTWLVYVADRVLDGVRAQPGAPLRDRHLFHARHRGLFVAAAIAAGSFLVWLILARMSTNARYEDTVLFGAALVYLFVVHAPRSNRGNWLPKELSVAAVFAAATAVPAWSRLEAGRGTLFPAVAIFAALCWLNCVAIERWENLSPGGRLQSSDAHPSTRWATEHFLPMAFVLAAGSAIASSVAPHGHATSAVYLAAMVSALLLAELERHRGKLNPLHLRVAADLALLTPLLVVPLLA